MALKIVKWWIAFCFITKVYCQITTNLTSKIVWVVENAFSNMAISENCSSQLKLMLKNENQYLKNFFRYSGKTYNDLGDYKKCKTVRDANFIEFSIRIPNSVFLRVGLCMPSNCRASDFNPYMIKVSQILKEQFKMDIPSSDIVFTNVEESYKKLSVKGQGFIIFWTLFFGFVIFQIIISIVDSNRKSDLVMRKVTKNQIIETIQTPWISSFNILRNYWSFVNIPASIFPELSSTNGIRTVCILYLLMCQGVFYTLNAPMLNLTVAENYLYTSFMAPFIPENYSFSTDIYYFTTAFLSVCGLIRFFENPLNRSLAKVLLIYLIRYIILAPLIIILMCLKYFLLFQICDSPMVSYFVWQNKLCNQQWWYHLLFIGNLFAGFFNYCNQNTWYIFTEMQIFILLPVLTLLYIKRKKVAYYTVFAFGLTTLITGLIVSYYLKWNPTFSNFGPHSETDFYFEKGIFRDLPALLGIIFGYMYMEYKFSPEKNQFFLTIYFHRILKNTFYRRCLYIFAVIQILISFIPLVYFNRNPDKVLLLGILWMHLSRPTFVLGVVFLIYPGMINLNKRSQSFFGYKLFNPLAKLSYATYAMHGFVLELSLAFLMNSKYYSNFLNTFYCLSFILLALIFGFVFHLLFQSPVSSIVRKTLNLRKEPSNFMIPEISS